MRLLKGMHLCTIMQSVFAQAIHWLGIVAVWIEELQRIFASFWYPDSHRMYYLGGEDVREEETVVPPGRVLVEEWNRGTEKRARVLYEDDEITEYEGDPWAPALSPWLWIGDEGREIELTETLQKYVLPGNFLLHDLLSHYVDHVDDVTYLDPRSLSFLKFPVEGIRV
jgi:hypothetical protein